MFVPNEPAFLAALQNDPAIWADAYDRKVIVSSPTNLFALLKLVADLWKYNDQDKNTKEIAACGLKLYEQLVAFTSSLEGVGTALDKAPAALSATESATESAAETAAKSAAEAAATDTTAQ